MNKSKISTDYLEKTTSDSLDTMARSKRVNWDENNLQQARSNVPDTIDRINENGEKSILRKVTSTVEPAEEVKKEDDGRITLKDDDILSGRGAGVNLHPGNIKFRKLIQANKENYVKSDPGRKKKIISTIYEEARSYGRFLKQSSNGESWIQISTDEAKKKVGQALRENAVALREKFKNETEKQKPRSVMTSHGLHQTSLHRDSDDNVVQQQIPEVYPTEPVFLLINDLLRKQNYIKLKQQELQDAQNELQIGYSHLLSHLKMHAPFLSSQFKNKRCDGAYEPSYDRSMKKRKIEGFGA